MKYLIISVVIINIVIWIPLIFRIKESVLDVYTMKNKTDVNPAIQIHNQVYIPYNMNNNITYVSANFTDIEKMLSVSYGVYQVLPLIIMD
jgi:hypothetical protein